MTDNAGHDRLVCEHVVEIDHNAVQVLKKKSLLVIFDVGALGRGQEVHGIGELRECSEMDRRRGSAGLLPTRAQNLADLLESKVHAAQLLARAQANHSDQLRANEVTNSQLAPDRKCLLVLVVQLVTQLLQFLCKSLIVSILQDGQETTK